MLLTCTQTLCKEAIENPSVTSLWIPVISGKFCSWLYSTIPLAEGSRADCIQTCSPRVQVSPRVCTCLPHRPALSSGRCWGSSATLFQFIFVTDCQPQTTVYHRWPSFSGRRCSCLEQSHWSCHVCTFRADCKLGKLKWKKWKPSWRRICTDALMRPVINMFNINPVYSVNNKNNNKLAWLFLWTWHYPQRCGCQLEAELKKNLRRCIDEARDQYV